MEEGTEVEVPSDAIGLIVGQPAHFRFFSSATRKDDSPGVRLQRWTDDEIIETDSLEAAFLILTGSSVRDEKADSADQIRQMAKMWRR